MVEGHHETHRPSFFDVPWRELSFEANLIVDRVPVPGSPAACGTPPDLPGLLRDTSSRPILTDGSVDPVEGRAGSGFYVPAADYRFGVRLPDDSSVLFSELYAIFSAIKYILRMGIADSVILSDSRAVLVCIRDRFINVRVPYIVHSVARHLLLASFRILGVYLSRVPAHSGAL